MNTLAVCAMLCGPVLFDVPADSPRRPLLVIPAVQTTPAIEAEPEIVIGTVPRTDEHGRTIGVITDYGTALRLAERNKAPLLVLVGPDAERLRASSPDTVVSLGDESFAAPGTYRYAWSTDRGKLVGGLVDQPAAESKTISRGGMLFRCGPNGCVPAR